MYIRSYHADDRASVERIHFETGFLGSSMDALITDPRLWDAKIAWYLEREPRSSFVLDSGSGVVGYLVGCLDDARSRSSSVSVLQTMVWDAVSSLRLPAQDRRFWTSRIGWIGDMLTHRSGELKLKTPRKAGHLHINLLPEARGQGYGSELLRAFEAYAQERGVTTLHAESFTSTLNTNTSFWERNGYSVYSEVPTTYWKLFVPEDVAVTSYRKDLDR